MLSQNKLSFQQFFINWLLKDTNGTAIYLGRCNESMWKVPPKSWCKDKVLHVYWWGTWHNIPSIPIEFTIMRILTGCDLNREISSNSVHYVCVEGRGPHSARSRFFCLSWENQGSSESELFRELLNFIRILNLFIYLFIFFSKILFLEITCPFVPTISEIWKIMFSWSMSKLSQ